MIRKKRAQFATTPLVVPINQKRERREASREVKALRAARLEQSIEKELLDRLRKGIYDTEETDGIVNADASAFTKALDQIEDELEEEQDDDEEEDYEALVAAADHSDTEADREYVSDMSASEGEEDDFEDWNVVQEEAGGLSSDSDSDSSDDGEAPAAPLKSALKSAKRPPKKQVKRANQKLEIEYEYENAANEVQQR
ncbi:Mak16-domain-containing protein [Caulochytrium protostelioides]|uniref:Mak16-domain-containing protein n=1 Tax=Caulochytrium protostelioides TaxID=1555241 RepID=A0A4P9WTN9_9FUNG|nr:Mak16-domain-containing protein [Caulochytrium protostelioides]